MKNLSQIPYGLQSKGFAMKNLSQIPYALQSKGFAMKNLSHTPLRDFVFCVDAFWGSF